MDARELEEVFPGLKGTQYRVTSVQSVNYNCIAWAAGKDDAWWWPDPMGRGYWPEGVARTATIDAFVQAFSLLGYSPCESGEPHSGVEKVSIYSIGEIPSHAARQLANGKWTSKLGKSVDIEHDLHALSGQRYGNVAIILHRSIAT